MDYQFRDKSPVRSCTKIFQNYKMYKEFLQADFNGRCAYCNLRDSAITTPFEIDHFIPRDVFKEVRPELLNAYDNLVYSCKKCNNAKSNQYSGDISQKKIDNNLFYDPVKTDYNHIFYRNNSGEICSDDKKGQNMIVCLNLYRPIHSLAWLCEQLGKTIDKLEDNMSRVDNDPKKYGKMKEAKYKLLEIEHQYNAYFIASYNNNGYFAIKTY